MEEKYNGIFAEWMQGKLTDEEVRSLVPEAEYLSFLKIRRGLEVYAELEQSPDSTWRAIREKMERKDTGKSTGRIMKLLVPAMSVAALFILFLVLQKLIGPQTVKVEVADASLREYRLPDGSMVYLHQGYFEYNPRGWKKSRIIRLNGDAYFVVQKGPSFEVNTPSGTVRVLGTRFEVKADQKLLHVICYRGKVSVIPAKTLHPVVLTSGKALKAVDGKIRFNNPENLMPGWLMQPLRFRSEPLGEILDTLEKMYTVRFDRSRIDEKRLFTGMVPPGDLKKSLELILKPMEIRYYTKGDSIILLPEDTGR